MMINSMCSACNIILSHVQDRPYQTISSDHFCEHKDGGYPSRCNGGDGSVEKETVCEFYCNSYSWCTGYSFDAPRKSCSLMTSVDLKYCPRIGSKQSASRAGGSNIATSLDELVPSTFSGFNCMGKRGNHKYMCNNR